MLYKIKYKMRKKVKKVGKITIIKCKNSKGRSLVTHTPLQRAI